MMQTLAAWYGEYHAIVIFLHVLSAVIWVGGMVAMRYAAHHSFQALNEPPERLERTAHALKRLFAIVAPFILILLATGLVMTAGMNLLEVENGVQAYVKFGVWGVMALNYLAMVVRRSRAETMMDRGNLIGARDKLVTIGKYMVPFNILLGTAAIYFGVLLRFAH
jgi:uncharacterized membrane protein